MNMVLDFYSCDIYKNRHDETILIICSTDALYLIDLYKKESKAILEYVDIKDVLLEREDKIIVFFKESKGGVYI